MRRRGTLNPVPRTPLGVLATMIFYRGDYRLRLRRAVWFHTGIRTRTWEITFDRGPAFHCAAHPSFTLALIRAIIGTYRHAWSLRHYPQQSRNFLRTPLPRTKQEGTIK